MNRSIVTWRLTHTGLLESVLPEASRLLAPIAHSHPDPNPPHGWASMGLHDHFLIEPEQEVTAGEIALNCLTKAHRLGRGWIINWPAIAIPTGVMTWESQAAMRRAGLPESMHGLSGWLDPSQGYTTIAIPDLHSVSFSVRVLEQPEESPNADNSAESAVSAVEPVPIETPSDPVSRAIVLYLGRGGSGYPKRDEERVAKHLGPEAAAAVLPRVRELVDDFYRARAFDTATNLSELATMAADEFRKKHPNISDEAIDALAWSYTWDYR